MPRTINAITTPSAANVVAITGPVISSMGLSINSDLGWKR